MKKFKLLATVCIIALVFGVVAAGCEGEVTPPAEEEEEEEEEAEIFELTFATQHPAQSPFHTVVGESWIRWLDRESGGRIKMTLLPAEQAAKAPDLYDACRAGTVDIACQVPSYAPGRFTLSEVTMLPLLFEFPGARCAGLAGTELYEKYPEILAEWEGVKFLQHHTNGPAHIHTTDKPIHTMEDLEGQVILAFGTYPGATTEALGATPEVVAIAEIYDALAKGVVDGIEGEWDMIYALGWYEVTNYSTEVGLYLMPMVHVMNLDTYNSLPPDLQELFVGENAWLWANLYGYSFDKGDIMFRELLNEAYLARGYPEVYILSDEERARWVEAVLPVRDQWINDAEALGAPARDILDDAIMFAEQYAYQNLDSGDWCEELFHELGALGY